MNEMQSKRESLVNFIKEQLEGPGAMGDRYVHTKDELGLVCEILNTAPANLYSTAILFPVDKSNSVQVQEEADQDVEPGSDEDVQSLNQMYPNSIALTVCLDRKAAGTKELKLMIQGRHYTQMTKDELIHVGVQIEQSTEEFTAVINQFPPESLLRSKLVIKRYKDKDVVCLEGGLTVIEIGNIKREIRALDKAFCKSLGSEKDNQVLAGYKDHLFNQIRTNVGIETDLGQQIITKLSKIERLECTFLHIIQLIEIYDSGGYGLWQCDRFEKIIELPAPVPVDIHGKIIFSPKQHPSLERVYHVILDKKSQASLSLALQFSKYHHSSQDIFMKVQLMNTSTEYTKTGDRYFSVANAIVNERSFFGIAIKVISEHLIPYRNNLISGSNELNEDSVNAYLYKQFKSYGVGHGCSVKWDIDHEPFVQTEFIPSYDVPDVDPVPRDKSIFKKESDDTYIPAQYFDDPKFLSFKWLSTLSNASDDEVIKGLVEFVEKYHHWILQQETGTDSIGKQLLSECKRDQERIKSNIEALLIGHSNSENLSTFRLMNTAMFMQLWHSEKVKQGAMEDMFNESFDGFKEVFYRATDDRLFDNKPAAWRPFQLAFILLNLDGIFQRDDDTEWKRRSELVDLVWFPTGGGKTEAYLGLIALTIINRRKHHKERGGGTAVIMRYTLRLLTTQQFQRATLLIMALELIRRWNKYGLGVEPIYIGLYVGQGSLPNKLKKANADEKENGLKEEYDSLVDQQRKGTKNPITKIPLHSCPWCGSPLNLVHYELVEDRKDTFNYNRVLLMCSRKVIANGKTSFPCAFSKPLISRKPEQGPIPVSLCDEEIYQHPPALLFGTVDKFAQLAHKVSGEPSKRMSDSRRLFGKGNWENNKPQNGYLSPDLIIQDELHLLLGPLGSAVGLFECAIDQMCERLDQNKRIIRPKVISSTATTRNTPLQIYAIFDRKVNLFPKPGLDCDDSFFAFYKRTANSENSQTFNYLSKRRYIGILPTGRTQIWMQMRLAAIILTHRALFEKQLLEDKRLTDTATYPDKLKRPMDYYHTLISYFNSLKEVGKTESQFYTYLIKEIRRVFNNVLTPGNLLHQLYTNEDSLTKAELTGNLSGAQVVSELDRVSQVWDCRKRFAYVNEEGKMVKGKTPPDFVVATNMISVGIDVSRFNSIIINSMPRNIAEYIQASSRVARNDLGLVITLHHPFRARDVSHYEKFIEFHSKMYSYVEPISITPFTKKSLERYLPLYVATIIRHEIEQFANRESAINITPLTDEQIGAIIQKLTKYFIDRMNRANLDEQLDPELKGLLTSESIDIINALIHEAIDSWKHMAEDCRTKQMDLVFTHKTKTKPPSLPQEQLYVDVDEYEENIHNELWQIPQSLRVVEPEGVINVKQK